MVMSPPQNLFGGRIRYQLYCQLDTIGPGELCVWGSQMICLVSPVHFFLFFFPLFLVMAFYLYPRGHSINLSARSLPIFLSFKQTSTHTHTHKVCCASAPFCSICRVICFYSIPFHIKVSFWIFHPPPPSSCLCIFNFIIAKACLINLSFC